MILVLLSVGTYAWAQECECGRPLATSRIHYEVYVYNNAYEYVYANSLAPTFMCYTKKEFDYANHLQKWALRDAGYWMSHPKRVRKQDIPAEILRSGLPPGASAIWVSYDWVNATVVIYSNNVWTIQTGNKQTLSR
jgi:hypothetical protein